MSEVKKAGCLPALPSGYCWKLTNGQWLAHDCRHVTIKDKTGTSSILFWPVEEPEALPQPGDQLYLRGHYVYTPSPWHLEALTFTGDAEGLTLLGPDEEYPNQGTREEWGKLLSHLQKNPEAEYQIGKIHYKEGRLRDRAFGELGIGLGNLEEFIPWLEDCLNIVFPE